MYTSDGTQDVDGDTTIDPKGYYRFRGLSITDGAGQTADDYLVRVNDTAVKLDGLTATYDLDGSGLPASGLVTGLGISRVNDLAGNVINHDFGFTPDNSGQQSSRTTVGVTNIGAIGDRVWLDIDSGDDQDASEPGIPGVRVNLYQDLNGDGVLDANEPLLQTTLTGPDGYYLFPNLPTGTSGDYIARVDTSTLPAGLTQTFDHDTSQTDGTSNVQNLAGTVLTEDFGYVGTGTVGNLVWNDINADGNVDAGENGIAGVTLDLYYDKDGDGDIDPGEPKLGTTTTDANGAYLFSGLPTDDGGGNAQYIVDVSDTAGVLNGYWHSLGNQSEASNNESKTDPYPVTLTPGAPNVLTADFGYYVLPAAVGNFVWNDTDGDGIQDAGEPGIDNVLVQLTITYPGANGVVGTGGDDTVTTIRTLTGDNPNQDGVQAGWYSFANLLQDEDYNGANTVGGGEPTFTVSVITADNTGALTGLVKTNTDQGGDDKLDSDVHAGVSASAFEGQQTVNQTSPATGEGNIASYDFGYTAPVNLGNRIWYDTDNDGIYEPNGNDGIPGTTTDNEVGINNVTVQLYRDTNGNGVFNSGTDTLVGTTTTDSSGIYNFTLLTPSIESSNVTKYLVVLPDTNFMGGGALVGYQNSTLTDSANSDVDNRDHGQVSGTLGSANGIVVTNGSVSVTVGGEPAAGVDTDGTNGNLTLDFGIYRLRLTGTVFSDGNNNGTLDTGENTVAAVNGRTVRLYQDTNNSGAWDAGDVLVATTTTNATGDYSFSNLTAGKYIVNVALPATYHSTIDTANQTDTNTPNTGADNNDNGVGSTYTNTYSRAFDLNPNNTTTNLGNSVNFADGTTSNNKQDFGINQSPTAEELGAVTVRANDDSTVTVAWESLNELTLLGFNIQRGAARDGDFANINGALMDALSPGTVGGNHYEFVDTGAEAGNTYFYRVQAVRVDTSTLESEPQQVKIKNACAGKTDATVLASPENGIKLDKGKVDFSWNPVACARRYVFELRAGSPDGELVIEKKQKATTFSIKKLDAGKTYYWRVLSCNAKDKCVAAEWSSFRIKKDKE
jgi:hypothetical protein